MNNLMYNDDFNGKVKEIEKRLSEIEAIVSLKYIQNKGIVENKSKNIFSIKNINNLKKENLSFEEAIFFLKNGKKVSRWKDDDTFLKTIENKNGQKQIWVFRRNHEYQYFCLIDQEEMIFNDDWRIVD